MRTKKDERRLGRKTERREELLELEGAENEKRRAVEGR